MGSGGGRRAPRAGRADREDAPGGHAPGGTDRAHLRVRVVPRASRTALTRDRGGALRAHLNAPPVEGAANRALLELLAERLRLPKRRLEIVAGARAREKVVRVHGCSEAELEERVRRALAGGGG
jgi:uncharacterized protein YggU (UPF0235/DUF167 family)